MMLNMLWNKDPKKSTRLETEAERLCALPAAAVLSERTAWNRKTIAFPTLHINFLRLPFYWNWTISMLFRNNKLFCFLYIYFGQFVEY